jgi:hypothetical protein
MAAQRRNQPNPDVQLTPYSLVSLLYDMGCLHDVGNYLYEPI